MFFQNINYIVAVIAAIAGMAAGFIWYAPWAFGELWLKSRGWTEESLRAKKHGKSMTQAWIGMSISTLATAIILSAVFNSLVIVSFWGILVVAISLWLGFAVPMKLGDYYFGADGRTFLFISIGHELLVILVMSLIIGIFG